MDYRRRDEDRPVVAGNGFNRAGAMKRIRILIVILLFGYSGLAQNFQDLSFGTDSTFEVVTWNIEWFPANGQTTLDYVTEIITALDVDILAIQEIDDISVFEELIDSLGTYTGFLESSYFAGLAYIYKTGTIQINDIYEIYTTNPYWSPFPRSPVVMDLTFMNERFFIINNHFKCCGDGVLEINDSGDEETRRYTASTLLKEYIDTYLPDENVILTGDLNDILSDNRENNIFQDFIDDTTNYLFADYEIAFNEGLGWSYPTWPSHLDHMLITNELFDEFENDASVIQTIKLEQYFSGGWWEYENNVSDHRPVGLKLPMQSNVILTDQPVTELHFSTYPNPFDSETTFTMGDFKGSAVLEIVNLQGRTVYKETIAGGTTSIRWNAGNLPAGIYLARVLVNNRTSASLKFVLGQ